MLDDRRLPLIDGGWQIGQEDTISVISIIEAFHAKSAKLAQKNAYITLRFFAIPLYILRERIFLQHMKK